MFGGYAAKRIAAGRNADGRLELFYAGTNDVLYHVWQVAPSTTWSVQGALGGIVAP